MPHFVTPNSYGTVKEFNPYHDPKDGKFTTGQGGAGSYKSPGERAAANGEIYKATPKAFKDALAKNSRADTLSDYDEATLSTFKLYLLKGGQAGYAIKPDGEFVNLFNNGPREQTGGAGPWLVVHAIERGATHGDHFDGYLTGFYKKLGWKETKREKNWTEGGSDVIYMRWDGDRHSARERYRRNGHLE